MLQTVGGDWIENYNIRSFENFIFANRCGRINSVNCNFILFKQIILIYFFNKIIDNAKTLLARKRPLDLSAVISVP